MTIISPFARTRARDALIGALTDDYDSVRFWAASCLGALGDKSAVEALIEALSDSYSNVRELAMAALARAQK